VTGRNFTLYYRVATVCVNESVVVTVTGSSARALTLYCPQPHGFETMNGLLSLGKYYL